MKNIKRSPTLSYFFALFMCLGLTNTPVQAHRATQSVLPKSAQLIVAHQKELRYGFAPSIEKKLSLFITQINAIKTFDHLTSTQRTALRHKVTQLQKSISSHQTDNASNLTLAQKEKLNELQHLFNQFILNLTDAHQDTFFQRLLSKPATWGLRKKAAIASVALVASGLAWHFKQKYWEQSEEKKMPTLPATTSSLPTIPPSAGNQPPQQLSNKQPPAEVITASQAQEPSGESPPVTEQTKPENQQLVTVLKQSPIANKPAQETKKRKPMEVLYTSTDGNIIQLKTHNQFSSKVSTLCQSDFFCGGLSIILAETMYDTYDEDELAEKLLDYSILEEHVPDMIKRTREMRNNKGLTDWHNHTDIVYLANTNKIATISCLNDKKEEEGNAHLWKNLSKEPETFYKLANSIYPMLIEGASSVDEIDSCIEKEITIYMQLWHHINNLRTKGTPHSFVIHTGTDHWFSGKIYKKNDEYKMIITNTMSGNQTNCHNVKILYDTFTKIQLPSEEKMSFYWENLRKKMKKELEQAISDYLKEVENEKLSLQNNNH